MAKIVLADNEDTNRAIHKKLLEDRGHEVHVFRNGLEALTYIQQNKADIVIADLDMPIMDGVDLLQNLKGYQLKRVLSSGAYSSISELKKSYGEVECDLYLSKPISIDDFLKKISEVLNE
jgi:CheY-like chemotaxis protein